MTLIPSLEVRRIHRELVELRRDTPKMSIHHQKRLGAAIDTLAQLVSCVPCYPQKPKP